MSEFRLTKREQEKLDSEVAEWFDKLNLIVAPIIFAVSGTFVGLVEESAIYGVILLIFSLSLMGYVGRYFPKTVEQLRTKENRTEREEIILKGIHGYYFFRWQQIRKCSLFWIAWLFMTYVALKGFI